MSRLTSVAGLGDRVEARSAVIVGSAPFRRDPALRFETLQRRIQSPVIDDKHFFGSLLNGSRDPLSMLWAEHQLAQDEQIECALK